MRVEKFIDIINRILSEELDIISEDKRNAVAERIAKELKIENYSILHLDDSGEEAPNVKWTVRIVHLQRRMSIRNYIVENRIFPAMNSVFIQTEMLRSVFLRNST